MACKNLYKGKWYTDGELINLLLTNDKIALSIVSDEKYKETSERESPIKTIDELDADFGGIKFQAPMAKTIEVDGVSRPTVNSSGNLIHPTEEGIRNFWKWFGNSKVVDKYGRPLVVYHGTHEKFDIFDVLKKGSRGGLREKYFAFTSNIRTAGVYANGIEENIITVYLKIDNMPVYNNKGKYYRNLEVFAGYRYANVFDLQDWHSKGFQSFPDTNGNAPVFEKTDGFVVKNTLEMEDFGDTYIDKIKFIGDTYYVMNPTQIKSTENTGAFGIEDERIKFQLTDPEKQNISKIKAIVDGYIANGLTNEQAVARALEKLRAINAPENIIYESLKDYGYAKEQQSGAVRPESEQGKGQGQRDSDMPKVNGTELQDGKEEKVSRAGLRYFTELSKVPKETQRLIEKNGVANYRPTSLEEAEQVAREIVDNNDISEVVRLIVDDADINSAVWINISVLAQQKLDKLISDGKKRGENVNGLISQQLSVVKKFVKNLSAAGLLMRASQADLITDYLAPATWVKTYIDAVKAARSVKSKWLERVTERFKDKARKEAEKTVEDTMNNATVKKAVAKAESAKAEGDKKRDAILKRWEAAIAKRNQVKFQAARVMFDWTEEDMQFAKEIVNSYIEDGIYNKVVIADKLRKFFDKLKISVSDDILERIIPTDYNGKTLDELFEESQLDKAAEQLANRIFGDMTIKEKKDDPIAMMVNTLMSKFRERATTPEKKAMSDMEKIVDAIRNFSEYKEVWEEARQKAIDLIDESEMEEIEKEEAKDKVNSSYDKATKFTFTENQVRRIVRKIITDNKIKMNDIVRSHLSVRGATRESLRQAVVDMSGLSGKEADILSESVYNIYERMLTDRATNLISKEATRMKKNAAGENEAKIRRTETEKLLDLILLKAFEDEDFRDAYASMKGIAKLNKYHVAEIERLADIVRVQKSTVVKKIKKDELLSYIKLIDGVSFQELLDTMWYGFVLSGVPTQIRNTYGAFSNIYGMLATEGVANPTAIPAIIKGEYMGRKMGKQKAGVVLKTGKKFFEDTIEAPPVSEIKLRENADPTKIMNGIAYVMRWMAANDQLALTIGKEGMIRLLAEAQLEKEMDVSRFKKMYDKKFRKNLQLAVDKLLSVSKEQMADIDAIVAEETVEFGYDKNEALLRKQELIDEARPIDLVKEAEKFASRATGNTKVYGTIGFLIEAIASPMRKFEVPIVYKGKEYKIHPFKLAAAFTKISANVATNQLSYTPVGFINALVNRYGFVDKKSPFYREMTAIERRKMIQRATVGTAIMAMLFALLDPDDDDAFLTITANGTGNFKDDEELKKGNWRPYSLYIGGMDGMRIPYRYSPFALLLAPLGYMSDHKKYVPDDRDKSKMSLVLKSAGGTIEYMAANTPLRGMMNVMDDLIGSSMSAFRGDNGARYLKTFSNMAKGIYAPAIARNVIDTWDYFTRENKPENNKIYNDYFDRTFLELVANPAMGEDNFPMRDAWGLPVQQPFPLDEFMVVGKPDEFTELRNYHYAQNAGTLSKPDRKRVMFDIYRKDGTTVSGLLNRNNREHREAWNEIYLKERGEKLREEVLNLKNMGYTGEEYVEKFNEKKKIVEEEAKASVAAYFLYHPQENEAE